MIGSTIDSLHSVPLGSVQQTLKTNLKLIKISNQLSENINLKSSTKTPKIAKKQASFSIDSTYSTSNSSSSDESSKNTKSLTANPVTTCKSSSYNQKEIYSCLNDTYDLLNKEILNDYFFIDNFTLEPTQTNINQITKQAGSTKPVNNNRYIELSEWNDGLNEWQLVQPYPSFKNYLNSYAKRKNTKLIEFDEDLGLYLPTIKPKQQEIIIQKPHQHNHSNYYTGKDTSSNLAPIHPNASLNTLNNNIASNKLIKELHKLVSSQSNQSYVQDVNRRANSASNKKYLPAKPAALPFFSANNLNPYAQLQLRSDELDRVKTNFSVLGNANAALNSNFRLDYKLLNQNTNRNLSQQHLTQINQISTIENFSNQDFRKNGLDYHFNVNLNKSFEYKDEQERELEENRQFLTNMMLIRKSDSDSSIKVPQTNNNLTSLNSISSRLLKVSPLNANTDPQSASSKQSKFYLGSEIDSGDQLINNELFNNQLMFLSNNLNSNNSNNNNTKHVQHQVKGLAKNYRVNQPNPQTSHTPLAIIKPLIVNTTNLNTVAQMHSGSNSGSTLTQSQKQNLLLETQSVSSQATNQNLDLNTMNSANSLPPIISGKRINLPLGPHRYL